jgi:hypothetical protein
LFLHQVLEGAGVFVGAASDVNHLFLRVR